MAYLFFLLFVYLFYEQIRLSKNKISQLLLISIPVILFWVLLIGGQYGVGTDYFSYLAHFKSNSADLFFDKKEYLFGYLILFCQNLGIYGQGIFMVISLIWIILLIIISSYLLDKKIRYIYIFFFVFIVFPTTFNNQMNGMRQYLAVYFFTLAACLSFYKKPICILFFAGAIVLHRSALVGIGIFSLIYILLFFSHKIKRKYMFLAIVLGVVLGTMLLKSSSISNILVYFQDVEELDYYVNYYGRHERDGKFMEMASKFVYIPPMLMAIYKIPNMKLNNLEMKFFILGVISYVIRIALVAVPYVGRTSAYFEITSCVPFVYLLIYYKTSRIKSMYSLGILYLLLPFAYKVTLFAIGEYDYHSYFLQ